MRGYHGDPSFALVGSDGTTADGYQYVDITALLGDGRAEAGETVAVWLSFSNPLRRQFTFDYHVRGLIQPLLDPDEELP